LSIRSDQPPIDQGTSDQESGHSASKRFGFSHTDESAALASPSFPAETLAASVAALLAMTVLQRAIGLARGVLFCRWLEPAELGQWDLAFGFLMLAAPLTVLGLTGSYGRYLEHYRRRGHVRSFVRRTATCVALLAAAAAITLAAGRGWFAEAIFAHPHGQGLLLATAAALIVVIAFNALFELFGGLRWFRVAVAMQFFHSLIFAALGIVLAFLWEPTALSLVVAFGGAYALCALGAMPWVVRAWKSLPVGEPLRQSAMWSRVVPFAASVWLINAIANLFDLVDRWMLVHYSGMDAAAALAAVGNYHAARTLTLPLLAVAALFRSALLPHLTHDWEAGRRQAVELRLSNVLKLWGLTLMVVSTGLGLAGPALFDLAFRGKYTAGLHVLPWTAMYLSWASLAALATTYAWCAERPGLSSIPLAAGLAANIGLNLLWLPRLGLFGAVSSTAAANLLALCLAYAVNGRLGAKPTRGVWAVSLAPLALIGGAPLAVAVTAALLHQAYARQWLLTPQEKERLKQYLLLGLSRLKFERLAQRPAAG